MFLEAVEKYPINNWIVWVGAGVSFPAPSSLPLGGRLCEFVLNETCEPLVPAKIFSIWAGGNAIASTAEQSIPFGPLPRLETILEAINDVQTQAKRCRFDFMSGFESLTEAPFNENHVHLAYLLSRGATIITTNFDTCIQAAYREIFKGKDELVQGTYKGIRCYTSKNHSLGGRLWHIHGEANDRKSLGATLHMVKEGVPGAFQKFLDKQLQKPSALIFLGYSGSDSFDINLYFSQKERGHFGDATGMFIQHGDIDPPPNARLLLQCFGTQIAENFDTTNALRQLSKADHKFVATNPFAWENAFRKHSVLADKDRVSDYVLCKIAFNLGINVKLLDAGSYQRALKSEHLFDPLDFHKTLALLCRLQADGKRERWHDERVKKEGKDLLGFYYAQGNLRMARKYSKSIEDLFNEVSSNIELDWSTYTSFSAHSRTLVMKYLLNPLSRISKSDRARMETLMNLASLLSQVPLKNVRFINQIATALRFKMLFNSLLANSLGNISEQILRLYAEGASIIGYVSAYRDMAISQHFLAKYFKSNTNSQAKFYLKKSLALAQLIGDVPGERHARRLLLFLSAAG